jgi:hypothetical protein
MAGLGTTNFPNAVFDGKFCFAGVTIEFTTFSNLYALSLGRAFVITNGEHSTEMTQHFSMSEQWTLLFHWI